MADAEARGEEAHGSGRQRGSDCRDRQRRGRPQTQRPHCADAAATDCSARQRRRMRMMTSEMGCGGGVAHSPLDAAMWMCCAGGGGRLVAAAAVLFASFEQCPRRKARLGSEMASEKCIAACKHMPVAYFSIISCFNRTLPPPELHPTALTTLVTPPRSHTSDLFELSSATSRHQPGSSCPPPLQSSHSSFFGCERKRWCHHGGCTGMYTPVGVAVVVQR